MKAIKSVRKITLVLTLLFSLPVGLFLVSQRTNLQSQAEGTPASLLVYAGTSFSRDSLIWKNLAQGGEEKLENGSMLTAVLPPLRSFRPQYIRLDHIYDYYDTVSKSPEGNLVFSWGKLDAVVAEITSTGALPFFALSLPDGYSLNDWQEMTTRVIDRYTNQKRIAGIYYEVGNEPDLFGGWKMGGSKNYLDLYREAALGAQRVSTTTDYKLGGPATTALYENWFVPLVNYAAKLGLRFDFYSWHRYSPSLAEYERDMAKAKAWREQLDSSYKDVELIISEMGHDTENHEGYDGYYSAIHNMAVLTALEGDIEKVFPFEIKDGKGPTQYWGRWGMFTHESWETPKEKERFKALRFMSLADGRSMHVIGEGSYIKAFGSREGDTLKVFVVNYDPAGKHTETVPITFRELPFSKFIYTRTNYNGSKTEKTVTVDGFNWNTVEFFNPNTAAIIELTPIK